MLAVIFSCLVVWLGFWVVCLNGGQVKRQPGGQPPLRIPIAKPSQTIKIAATLGSLDMSLYGVSPSIAATMDKAVKVRTKKKKALSPNLGSFVVSPTWHRDDIHPHGIVFLFSDQSGEQTVHFFFFFSITFI